jgi:transposase
MRHIQSQGGEREALISWFPALAFPLNRMGQEAGPLPRWLHAALAEAGLAVELLETRHVRDAVRAMPVKTDRKDARGLAQLMRLGWFRLLRWMFLFRSARVEHQGAGGVADG